MPPLDDVKEASVAVSGLDKSFWALFTFVYGSGRGQTRGRNLASLFVWIIGEIAVQRGELSRLS